MKTTDVVCKDTKTDNDNVSFRLGEKEAFIAKVVSKSGMRTDGKNGNIVYDPQRIWE